MLGDSVFSKGHKIDNSQSQGCWPLFWSQRPLLVGRESEVRRQHHRIFTTKPRDRNDRQATSVAPASPRCKV